MATNFFTQQDQARSATTRLVVLFTLAVLGIIAAVYGVVLLGFVVVEPDHVLASNLWWMNGKALFIAACIVLPTVVLGSWLKIRELSDGGASVALSLGGRLIDPGSRNPLDRRLLNVVEEMAIASGTPVPMVFVLDRETGINAFAAGYSERDAAIAVTRGALDVLSREQLQGVVAHEFSHILNGDMRLNIRLVGLLHGILVIGATGLWVLKLGLGVGSGRRRERFSNDRGGAIPIAVAGLLLAIVGYIGVFFGRLIQAAVSRQREYLADASAVQFTRNPNGLAGALQAIGGHGVHAAIHARGAQEMSHLFFGDITPRRWFSWMATHPPLTERIRRLDPTFDGTFPAVTADQAARIDDIPSPVTSAVAAGYDVVFGHMRRPDVQLTPFTPVDPRARKVDVGTVVDIRPSEVVPLVGTLSPGTAEFGATMIAAIPDVVRAAAREPVGAIATVYALVADDDVVVREVQLEALRGATHPAILRELGRLLPHVHAMPHYARLPLAELCVPSLRSLSPEQAAQFGRELAALVQADDRITLFEFLLQRSVRRWVIDVESPAQATRVEFLALRPLLPDIAVLLSSLAWSGHGAEGDADRAFAAGRDTWRGSSRDALHLLPPQSCGTNTLDDALGRLGRAAPVIKQRVIDAGARVVLADATVTLEEYELLRVVADSLSCPLPPLTPDDVEGQRVVA